jgi:hypothetical protein
MAVLAAACSNLAPTPAAEPGAAAAPMPAGAGIGHVFVLVLENEDYENSFGADSPAAYLAKTLPAQGLLLPNYYGTGHNSLDNYISMISGQAPNADTQADCRTYTDFVASGPLDANGQLPGHGCAYPATVSNLADQLEQAGLSWRGYMEDMGRDHHREATACGHPDIGTKDPSRLAQPDDQYATKHDPFVYFHSIIDDPLRCAAHVVNLEQLPGDLAVAAQTPNLVFISPGLCHDGHDSPCVNGEPGGLVSADAFLRQWVPLILASEAFRRDGLLIVTFDESSGPQSDSSACCDETPGPNAARPGLAGPGGGRTGTVLLSPFIKPGSNSDTPYNHYALLRSIEDIFGLPYLGYAGAAGLKGFGPDVYTRQLPRLPDKH